MIKHFIDLIKKDINDYFRNEVTVNFMKIKFLLVNFVIYQKIQTFIQRVDVLKVFDLC